MPAKAGQQSRWKEGEPPPENAGGSPGCNECGSRDTPSQILGKTLSLCFLTSRVFLPHIFIFQPLMPALGPGSRECTQRGSSGKGRGRLHALGVEGREP